MSDRPARTGDGPLPRVGWRWSGLLALLPAAVADAMLSIDLIVPASIFAAAVMVVALVADTRDLRHGAGSDHRNGTDL